MKKERKTAWAKIEPRLGEIGKLYGNGMTRKQICDYIGISENTLRTHEKQKEALAQVMKQARAKVLYTLTGKLYELATGAKRKSRTVSNGRIIETEETLPPSLPAILRLGEILDRDWIAGNVANDSPEELSDAEKRARACRMLGIPDPGYDRSTWRDDLPEQED
ncbi:MAG: hypothetical protein IKW49_02760 [Opitutales bacterium]|nr:hypothetical protein [Opitutales bacterium]